MDEHCDQCGKDFNINFRLLIYDPIVKCPHCGARYTVELVDEQ